MSKLFTQGLAVIILKPRLLGGHPGQTLVGPGRRSPGRLQSLEALLGSLGVIAGDGESADWVTRVPG